MYLNYKHNQLITKYKDYTITREAVRQSSSRLCCGFRVAPRGVRGRMLMCLIECMIHWTPRHQDKQTLYSCHFTFSLTLKLVCLLTKNYQMSRSVFESFANWKSQSLYPPNQCFYWERSLLDNNAESINNTWEQLAELTAVGSGAVSSNMLSHVVKTSDGLTTTLTDDKGLLLFCFCHLKIQLSSDFINRNIIATMWNVTSCIMSLSLNNNKR